MRNLASYRACEVRLWEVAVSGTLFTWLRERKIG